MIANLNNDLLSVIIPAYNCEQYIERCLLSVTNQTYTNIEIIVVNDGSSDGTLEKCEYLSRLDSRIVILSQKNQGVTSARISGLSIAKGKWITFLDSDDYVKRRFNFCSNFFYP